MSSASRVPVIGVLVGADQPSRVGRQLAGQVAELARLRSAAVVRVVDLAEVGLPGVAESADEPGVAEAEVPEPAEVTREHGRACAQAVASLDAVIVVSAQHDGGCAATLQGVIDAIGSGWRDKPILLVTYGHDGGGGAAEQLASALGGLQAQVLSPRVSITVVDADLDSSGGLVNPCDLVERHRAELEVGFAAVHIALGC